MIWPARHTKVQPPVGTLRFERYFAFWPVRIGDNIVWLEFYEVMQVYRITEEKVVIDDKPVTFLPGKWVNITKRCKI